MRTTYRDVVLADRPRAYWPLDDLEHFLVSDDFNRADSATDPGPLWTGLGGGTWGISSNQLYNPSATNDSFLYTELGQPAGMIIATLNNTGGGPAVYFRVVDANNWFRVALDGGVWWLQKKVAGIFSTITQFGSGWGASTYTVVITINPTTNVINVYPPGYSFSGTDSALSTATKAGPGIATGHTSVRIDNFQVWGWTAARDMGGGGHHGTFMSFSAFTFNQSGGRRRGARFGAGAYIDTPSGSWQTGKSSFSRECWITSTSATDQFLLAQYAAANGEDFWMATGAGSYRVFMFVGSMIYDRNGTAPTNRSPLDGRPHHLVYCRQDGGEVRIYRDGEVVDSGSGGSGNTLTSSNPLRIGRQVTDNQAQFLGVMSDAAVYDYALTRDQVLRHYQAGRGLLRGMTRRAA